MRRRVDRDALSAELNRIDDLDRPALLDLWHGLHGRSAPKNLSVGFLRRVVTYEVQCRAFGGLNGKTKTRLRRMAKEAALTGRAVWNASNLPPAPTQKLVPGARLVRDWNGKTWVVDVTDAGFTMQGETYRSLTAIAKRITGAHWSGPRFFGLKGVSGTRVGSEGST